MSTRSMLTPSPKEKPRFFLRQMLKRILVGMFFFKHTTRNNVFQCIAFCFVFLLLAVYIHNITIHILTIPFVCWAETNDCWCASAKVFESVQLSLSQSYKWPFKGAAFDPGVRKSVATKACLSGISELSRLLELSQIQTEFYYLSYSEHTGHSEISWNSLNFLSKILFIV